MSDTMPYRVIATIKRYRCTCTRCSHVWESEGEKPPASCAGCKSKYWNVAPGTRPRGRPPKKKAR
jgi:Zn finger protein HypA/HybF involved in hydrogenase expression